MKKINKYWGLFPVVAFFSLLSSSCNSEDAVTNAGEKETGLICDAKGRTFDVSGQTRSALDYSASSGMMFKWTAGDWLTVFAKDNDLNIMNFSITGGQNTTHATFTSANFALTPGTRYYSLSKSEQQEDKSNISIPSQNNITLNYAGQVQDGNGNPSHLGKYDFMVASALCEEENNAHFSFTHLGATLRLDLYVSSANQTAFNGCTFNEVELYDSENSFVQPQRVFKFSAGATDSGYSPVWPSQDLTSPERFKVQFKSPGVKPTDAFNDKTTNTDHDVLVYIEVPPHDFTGKKLGVMLRGKDSGGNAVTYSGTVDGMNVLQDKAYKRFVKMSQPDEFKVQLKIARNWQLGSDLDATTRATGDPGKDEDFKLPTNIYYVYCFDDEVVKPQNTSDAQIITKITGIPESDWTKPADEELYTYKNLITLQKPACKHSSDPNHKCSYRLYVAASRDNLSDFFPIITVGAAESKVKGVTYNISTSDPQESTQSFLKNLYSTAWDSEGNKFQGTITDPMQDVILYHTAAKVDLKWNSTTALPVTEPSRYVKVNNVRSSNLSLFKPTANPETGTANYTVSTPFDEDTRYNGRQVYYLPQFNTYNVTVGSDTRNVDFTPATTNGFTSWLRWLKNY